MHKFVQGVPVEARQTVIGMLEAWQADAAHDAAHAESAKTRWLKSHEADLVNRLIFLVSEEGGCCDEG